MKILGIQLGHNASVCLLIDGVVVSAVSQEKFDNVKNSAAFPREAIEWTLREAGIDRVDTVAVAGIFVYPAQLSTLARSADATSPRRARSTALLQLCMRLAKRLTNACFSKLYRYAPVHELYWAYLMRMSAVRSRRARTELTTRLAPYVDPAQIVFVEHHVCHAYAAFYAIAQNHTDRALIVTADGSGDRYAATVNVFDGTRIVRVASTRWIYSLGYIYSLVTRFLGMTPLEHEYKVMGLAPYAKEQYVRALYDRVFAPLLMQRPGHPLEFVGPTPSNRSTDYFHRTLVGQRFDTVAGAVQLLTERLLTGWIRDAIRATATHTVYTGGGVFMNVKANMAIADLSEVHALRPMPSCGDESNPFGAVYYTYHERTGRHPQPLPTLYLGPSYTTEEVRTYLTHHQLHDRYVITEHDDIEGEIAELLAQFVVVARFKGRAEWGARSLGNRAIVANPSDLSSFYEVNDAIKQRDFWMPFAPSILDTDADRYIDNPKQIAAPHMILGFRTTPLGREHLRAAMHQADKTVRPQIVTKEAAPEYWHLIDAFKARTGIGAVMNTSFNLHGYPLVATLDQAFFTLERSGLRYLALDQFMIRKA